MLKASKIRAEPNKFSRIIIEYQYALLAKRWQLLADRTERYWISNKGPLTKEESALHSIEQICVGTYVLRLYW